METVNQILLVDHNSPSNSQASEKIKNFKLANKVKVTLNGGHALLYLEQVSEQVQDSSMVILLNPETPIMNGFEFIAQYNTSKSILKEKILLIVLSDNLNDEKMELLRMAGVSNFIIKDFEPEILSDMVRKHFRRSNNPVKLKTKLNGLEQLQRMSAA